MLSDFICLPDSLENVLVAALYRENRASVYDALFGYLQDHEAVEDVLQQAFLKFKESFCKINLLQDPSSYLYVIALNEARSWKTRGSRCVSSGILLTGEDGQVTDDFMSLVRREQRLAYKKAVAVLPALERKLLYYKLVKRKSFEEIAGLFGVSTRTVKRYMRSVKKKLQFMLREMYE